MDDATPGRAAGLPLAIAAVVILVVVLVVVIRARRARRPGRRAEDRGDQFEDGSGGQ
jgi:hypothetical protein